MSNNILKYTSKDYISIKDDLIDSIGALTDIWTSRENGDPGIVLVKLMSALGDMLSYNMDKQSLEYYAPTVTQRKNAARLFELLGYQMHWYQSAMTNLTVVARPYISDEVITFRDIYNNQSNYPEVNAQNYDTNPLVQIYLDYESKHLVIQQAPINPNKPIRYMYVPSYRDGDDEYLINCSGEDSSQVQSYFPGMNKFRELSIKSYKEWVNDNGVALHTFISDQNKTLSVFGSDGNSISYTLLPQIDNFPGKDSSGRIKPTFILEPYKPYTFTALEGTLAETNFTASSIRNNKYYIQDTAFDGDYMYLTYTTSGSGSEIPIVITKVDNLLTQTDGKIHFQFKVDDFDFPYIELSSFWKDKIGNEVPKFTLYYIKSRGKFGNITNNYLTTITQTNMSIVSVTNLDNNNAVYDDNGKLICKPGTNPQTAAEAYLDSLNYIQTYSTLVTVFDFARFVRRQNGFTNAISIDVQRANDLNEEIQEICSSYTLSQLQQILGRGYEGKTQNELATELYNIRKINYSYMDNDIVIGQDTDAQEYVNYMINIYPIFGNYQTYVNLAVPVQNEDVVQVEVQSKPCAEFIEVINDVKTPYKLYKITTPTDYPNDPYSYTLYTALNGAFRECHIVNVKPDYAPLRVFDWRCCGTIHLSQSVSQSEANEIVRNVINTLNGFFSPSNLKIGSKITYMEVINTILTADNRIRYFDAGIGTKPLIVFSTDNISGNEESYYNIEAYFNPQSIMRYIQTFDENIDENSNYYQMIYVDPTYIQT